MTTYKIDYQGKTYQFDGPEKLTEQQALSIVKGKVDKPEEPPVTPAQKTEMGAGSEPDFGTNFLGGLASPAKGTLQLGSELTGLKAPTSQQTGEGTTPADKRRVPMAEADPRSWGYLTGQFASGAGLAGAAMKAIPATRGVLGSTAMGGAAGLTDPVENITEHNSYFKQKVGQVEGGLVLGFGFGLAGKALTPGVQWLVNQFLPGTPISVEDRAVNVVLKRINGGNKYGAPSATDMMMLLATSKKPQVLADMGGADSELSALSGRITRTPGDARARSVAFLNQRDQTAPQRLEQDISQNVWAGASKYKLGKDLMAVRDAAARPAYEKADELQGIWSPDFQKYFLNEPEVQKGLRMGFVSERIRANAAKEPFDPTMIGIDLDPANPEGVKILKTPNLRVLDMGKRGLDAMIAAERDPAGRLSSRGRDLELLRQAYVKEIDAMDPKGIYKAARETWSGPMRAKDMMDLGYSVFKRGSEENADIASRLDENDKQFVLAGVAQQLREKLEGSGFKSNEAGALLKNPAAQKQLTPFLGSPQKAKEFIEAVTIERQMAEKKTELTGGAATAKRLIEEGGNLEGIDALRAVARMGHHTVHQNKWLLAGEAIRFINDIKGKSDPELEDAVARILFDPNITKTEMGRRIAAGQLIPPPESKAVNFAKLLQSATGPAAAGITSALPSTHPHGKRTRINVGTGEVE